MPKFTRGKLTISQKKQKIRKSLGVEGFDTGIYSPVEPSPTEEELRRGHEIIMSKMRECFGPQGGMNIIRIRYVDGN